MATNAFVTIKTPLKKKIRISRLEVRSKIVMFF